jgi:hypothetical protein
VTGWFALVLIGAVVIATAALEQAMLDYARLRDKARACAASKIRP